MNAILRRIVARLRVDPRSLRSAEKKIQSSALAGRAERQLEVKSLDLLKVLDDLEQIASLRIAAWTEHAHQALRGPFCCSSLRSKVPALDDSRSKQFSYDELATHAALTPYRPLKGDS